MPDLKPRYEVEKLEGTRKRTITVIGKGGAFTQKEVEEPAGFMVYLPSGASFRVRTKEELARRGFNLPPETVDMDTGEVLGVPSGSLKAVSQQKEVKRRGMTPPVSPTT